MSEDDSDAGLKSLKRARAYLDRALNHNNPDVRELFVAESDISCNGSYN